MGEILRLVGSGWALAALVMLALWLLQRRTGNAGVVDVGWAGATGALAVLYAVLGDGDPVRRLTLGFLGATWGGRLAWHLLRDRVLGRPEEGRYVTLRRQWSPHADRAFFFFYQAQALAAVALSLPFALAATASTRFPAPGDAVAAILIVIGVVGESVADRQLAAFKRDPAGRGRTCRRGLWRYSRHPNYFFEWLIWVAFAVFAMGSPYGYVAVFAPLLMLFFLFRVTGIPATEAQALRSKGDDYRRYQQTTSAFVPWFPRS
jgi:steroid 5-alpha reductase family enzyme